MSDRYDVTYQGRRGSILRRGLTRPEAEREAATMAKALNGSSDHVEIRKSEWFTRQDNAIYRRYKQGGS